MRLGFLCAIGAVCLASSAAFTHAPSVGGSSFAPPLPPGSRKAAWRSATRGRAVGALPLAMRGDTKTNREGLEGQEGGGGSVEVGKEAPRWRSRAASLAAACSVLLSASGAQAVQAQVRPASLTLRASRAAWYIEDKVDDFSDAMVDAYDITRGAVKRASKDKSMPIKAGAGVAFMWGSVVGLRRVSGKVEVEETAKGALAGAIGTGAGLIGDGWTALSSAMEMGVSAVAGGDEGLSSEDKDRQRRRRELFQRIEKKVERGGTSSLSADEFQLMYSELNDMITHGDGAMREVSEEEIEQRKADRERRREERRARLAAQGEIDRRIRQRIGKSQFDDM